MTSRYHPLAAAKKRLAHLQALVESDNRARLRPDVELLTQGDAAFEAAQRELAGVHKRFTRVICKKFASGKMQFVVAGDSQGLGKLATKWNARKGSVAAQGSLVLLRESQRCLKVGNRWHSKPMTSRFTQRGRDWLRDGCQALKETLPGRPVFVTLTFPGSYADINKDICVLSGYVVNRFNRWLQDTAIDKAFLYCWEYQQRGVLHLHYVFRVTRKQLANDFYKAVRVRWSAILRDIKKLCSVDLFQKHDGSTWDDPAFYARIQVDIIKRDIGRYLAKYISKAKTKGYEHFSDSPGRWYGISKAVRELVERERECIELNTDSTEAALCAVDAIRYLLVKTGKQVYCHPPSESSWGSVCVFYYSGGNARKVFARLVKTLVREIRGGAFLWMN